jgi:hypothetical protein
MGSANCWEGMTVRFLQYAPMIICVSIVALCHTSSASANESGSGQHETDLPPADTLRGNVLQFLESLRVQDPGTPYGVYRTAVNREPDLYATCNAAMIRYIVNDLELEEKQRKEWVDYINSYQAPETGKYPSERFLHLFGTAIRALNMLGGQPEYPPAFLKQWDDLEYTKQWMENLRWDLPWEPSILILHVAAPRGAAVTPDGNPDPERRQWLSAVLDWLDAKQDPVTGYWGPNCGSSTFDGMGATFHFFPLYEAVDREVHYACQLIDSTIAIQNSKYGTWGGVFADMDAVSMLVHLYSQSDCRREQIERSVRTSIDLLFRTAYDPKTGAFGTLGDTLGACEHLAEASRILNDHPYADIKWRRAWDWRLWRCDWDQDPQDSDR